MEAKIVDLQEWVSFGGGGFGESYYNKTDDSVILKLNKPSISASKAEEEFLRSKAVFQMGIPSAEPYEFVTDGQRYGMTVQRIQGKESFGRIIADHPERLEELAGVTAEYAKALHSIPCNTESFDNLALRTREMIMENKVIPDHVKARLAGYLDELEPANTCLHGDLNPCNIITANGKVYWIDLGDFGYGDPLLDFNILSHMSGYGPNPLLKHLFHMDVTVIDCGELVGVESVGEFIITIYASSISFSCGNIFANPFRNSCSVGLVCVSSYIGFIVSISGFCECIKSMSFSVVLFENSSGIHKNILQCISNLLIL